MSFSISWQFDSILVFEIENRLDSIRFDFKKVEIESSFELISKVGIDESNRFLKLESKSNPTISLNSLL